MSAEMKQKVLSVVVKGYACYAGTIAGFLHANPDAVQEALTSLQGDGLIQVSNRTEPPIYLPTDLGKDSL